jgi:2-oxoglutarate dehydrogenase E2 component (dihydrolipoamide succinyltransferase)
MSVEVRVPTLGESIVEATISQWNKREGERVTAGETLLELETDKVNLEIPVEHDGVIVSVAKGEGETVAIGDVLCVIDDTGGNGVGDEQSSPPPDTATPAPAAEPAEPAEPAPESHAAATPVAQRIAEENNLDIHTIVGSGSGGRVTKDDVMRHVEQHQAAPQPTTPPPVQPATPPPSAPSTPQSTTDSAPSAPATKPAPETARLSPQRDARAEERIRMSRRRQTIAHRLVEAQHTAAMLTTFNEIDMGAIMDVRKRRKDQFKDRYGVGLGFMSFFVRAVVGALKAFPLLNAEIQEDEIVVKYYYDIGIAVGSEQGLVVPVLRDAERKTFAEIEQGIAELATRARNNTLTLEDLRGGTFSITNGGIYGSLNSTPILNTPQVGILGMHKIEDRPMVVNGEIAIRPMMYVALSYDHRIVDGSDAVRFLVRIKELAEDPEVLLLEG